MSVKATDERVQEMLKGRRAVRVVTVPGLEDDHPDVKIGLRVLTSDEIADAKINASQYVAGVAKERRVSVDELVAIDPSLWDDEYDRQVLFRACVVAEADQSGDREPFFDSPRHVGLFDGVWVQVLHLIYVEHQDYVNPTRSLSDEEARELADTLGKAASAGVMLSRYDAPSLIRLVRTLASRLATSPTGKSSGGSTDTPPTDGP